MPRKTKNSAGGRSQPLVPVTPEQSKTIDHQADELKVAPPYVQIRAANLDPAFMDFAFKISGMTEAQAKAMGWNRDKILSFAKKQATWFNKAVELAEDDNFAHLYEQSGGNVADFAIALRAVAVKKKNEMLLEKAVTEGKLLDSVDVDFKDAAGAKVKF